MMVSFKTCMFYTQLKDFCNTCVHFQWKKTNSSRHIGILSALRMRGLHDKRQLLAKLRITGSENCGQNALSKGVRTEWDLNPRPSDCKSRA